MTLGSLQLELPLPKTSSEVFSRIRDFLAGRHVGATRDSALLDQLLLCLFAKLYLVDRQDRSLGSFRTSNLKQLYTDALAHVRAILGSVSLPRAVISLDNASLEFVDRMLSLLDLSSDVGDLVGDAYQCFCGADSRGQDGQFFTPRSAIKTLISLVDPKPGETIIDPACGAGGFLFAATRHLLNRGVQVDDVARNLFGVDKDAYLARLARMRVSLLTRHQTKVSVGDSLAWRSSDPQSFMRGMGQGDFDVVLTNPPFGARIVAASESIRRQFALAHRWVEHRNDRGRLMPSNRLAPNSPPQVLFIEKCISLVRQEGRIGIVVPESLLSGTNYRHVVEYVLRTCRVEAVVGMPEELFKTSGKGGTHTKTALLLLRRVDAALKKTRYGIFMAEAEWCGHDSRGRAIPKDDTKTILDNYAAWKARRNLKPNRLGFAVSLDEVQRTRVLAPRAHDPEIKQLLESLAPTHIQVRFGDLVDQGLLSLTTGDEVGKLAYGTGEIPFIRTSDISNWEIKIDPKHGVSREIYEALKDKQDVQPGDLLLVRDGTYLIGTCAMVTKYDSEMLFQSHIYKIRVHPNELVNAFLLLAILSSPVVQRQIKALSRAQDIIESLGSRINEVMLPIPRSERRRRRISESVQRVIQERVEAREVARQLVSEIASVHSNPDND